MEYKLKLLAQSTEVEIDEKEQIIFLPHTWTLTKFILWLDENNGHIVAEPKQEEKA